jgi:hypothetical protein
LFSEQQKRFSVGYADEKSLEPCESRCILKPALAPPSAVGGQNVFIPSESRSLPCQGRGHKKACGNQRDSETCQKNYHTDLLKTNVFRFSKRKNENELQIFQRSFLLGV